MKCGAVQTVGRVVGATCASAEERYKGQLNSEAHHRLDITMASYVPETICSPTKPSRIGNVDAFSANGYLKSSAGICYGYQKDNDMSSQELDRLLMGMDLNDQHIHLFREKAIDMDTFLILTEEDLIEIGIEDPDSAVSTLRVLIAQCPISTLCVLTDKCPHLTLSLQIRVLDATKIMLSSTNHLDTLYNLLKYVQLRLRDQPVINQFLYDQYSASEGAEEMTKLLLQRVERLHDELQGLQDDINQVSKRPLARIIQTTFRSDEDQWALSFSQPKIALLKQKD
uniref:SAM domain-containing protein n=1 Tax=Timema poppense TaxID=170557 RepID=A0A7R9CV42_TIMPO|nr:unnamed protein product [Timema poppensis]